MCSLSTNINRFVASSYVKIRNDYEHTNLHTAHNQLQSAKKLLGWCGAREDEVGRRVNGHLTIHLHVVYAELERVRFVQLPGQRLHPHLLHEQLLHLRGALDARSKIPTNGYNLIGPTSRVQIEP